MNDREKLIALIENAKRAMKSENLSCNIARNGFVADFLIANGVVVREKGEWLNRTKNIRGLWDYRFDCSVCGEIFWHPTARDFNFCPNCGADMRIEEQNRAREGENG